MDTVTDFEPTLAQPTGLTEQQQTILDIECQFWRTAGAKEDAIRDLGLTPMRFYQLLNQLVDSPAALQAEPGLVKRLARVRTDRRRSAPPR